MINLRNLTWILPLFVFIASPLWYGTAARFLTPKGGFESTPNFEKKVVHDFTMNGVFLIQSKHGVVTAEIEADEAHTGATKTDYLMTNVFATLYSDTGEITEITSKKGIFYSVKEQLTLIDDVVVVKPEKNQRLYSDLLHYFDKKHTVYSPGKTRLTSDTVEVRGTSLHYDMNTGAYEITGRVYCTVKSGTATP